MPTFQFELSFDLFISEKKNRFDYTVHGIQIDRLELTVSTQKSVLKNMHRVSRYYQKSVENQTSNIWYILADISGCGAYFSKPLKPSVRAGQFEYHKPYNPRDFFRL